MFGLFGGSKKKNEAVGVPDLTSAVESSILGTIGSRSLPPMPGAAQKAFKLSVDPNAEARDFIDVIESDEALSARILKIANSVYFDRGNKSQTIEQAVVVIGLAELRSLLNATSLSEIFPSTSPARAVAWANDIATALIARSIAQRVFPAATEQAFLAGLMHDIGRLLLIQRAGDIYTKVLKQVEEKGLPFHLIEVELLPFDHTEVGHLIAKRWNFTPELTNAIRKHHSPLSDYSGPSDIAAIVHCADAFAHALGLGHTKGMNRLRNTYEEKLPGLFEFLSIPMNEQKQFAAQLQRSFETEYDLYSGKGV